MVEGEGAEVTKVRPIGWSVRTLAELLGEPATTATHWVNAGLVSVECRGRGRAGHVIGEAGLRELLAVSELRGVGISPQSVRSAVEELRGLAFANPESTEGMTLQQRNGR